MMENYANAITADAQASCITMPSAANVLTITGPGLFNTCIILMLIENANMFCMFLENNSACKSLLVLAMAYLLLQFQSARNWYLKYLYTI